MTDSQQIADLRHGSIHLLWLAHTDEDRVEPRGVEYATQCGADGNEHKVVLVGAVSQDAFRFQHTNHLKRIAANANFPANRVVFAEEHLLDSRPENGNPARTAIVVRI